MLAFACLGATPVERAACPCLPRDGVLLDDAETEQVARAVVDLAECRRLLEQREADLVAEEAPPRWWIWPVIALALVTGIAAGVAVAR